MEQYLDLMGGIIEKPEYKREGGQEKIINQEKEKEVKQLELRWEQLLETIATEEQVSREMSNTVSGNSQKTADL